MTQSQYRFDVYDLNGNRQFSVTDFLEFSYTAVVNAPGMLLLQIAGDHAMLSEISDKWEIEVWRRPPGQSWNQEMVAMYRDLDWLFTDKSTATLYCPGIMQKLKWRIVNWAAGVNLRSEFRNDPAETVMKNLVEYNCAAGATVANGRKRDGAITGVSVEADGASGNLVDWYCHGKNVLLELQELGLLAGGDFNLIKTGTNTYEFRWYEGQLGTDRSLDVTFSMKYGNMGLPHYKEQRMTEKTVAAVWGQGEGDARDYVTRTSAGYSASNDIEDYVDAREITQGNTFGLQIKGDRRLFDNTAVNEFTFETRQTPGSLYGVHYALGDLVTAINPYNGDEIVMKLNRVTVDMIREGKETVVPEFSDIL